MLNDMTNKTIYITEGQYNSLFEVEKKPGTMLFWHGGNLDKLDQNYKQKGGRYEYGPGLYLITNYSEAIKYSRGSRKLYQVEVAKGNDIHDVRINLDLAKNFVMKNCIKTKINDIMYRLDGYSKDGSIPGFIFNNLIINFESLKPANTNNLKNFYIENGIDYEIIDNPFGWNDAKMMVLYNTYKIVNIKRITPNDKIEKFDLHESNELLSNTLRKVSSEITNTIPKLFKEKVDQFYKEQKMVSFEIDDVKVYIYDSSINKTRTGTPIFPKHIYLNVDYLSDMPGLALMGHNNIYIDLYYAFLHEMGHITSKIPPEAMPDQDYNKYINSKAEKHAMEFASIWLRSFTEPIYKKYNDGQLTEAEYNYHFGNIEDPKNVKPYLSDNKYRMSGRGTGHFGSGVYFSTYKCNDKRDVNDKHIETPDFIQIKDGVYRADFDLYKNLYRVKTEKQGDNLFYSLKEINGLYDVVLSYVKYKYQLPSNFSERYVIVKNNFKYLGLKIPDYREFIKMCIEQVKNEDLRSMSTVIMEYNGFNGVNVSGVYAYDNTTHGSVIYDLSKVSNDIKEIKVDHYNCELNRSETYNKVAGPAFDFKKQLLSDKDILSIHTDEFNNLPENEQLFAINRYKYLLDEFTLEKLNKQTINAYFKSLPRKLRNNVLLNQKITSRHITPIIDYGYSNIIYDINNKIGDKTFLEYAMDKLAYSNEFDKLVQGINRPLTDSEKEELEWYK